VTFHSLAMTNRITEVEDGRGAEFNSATNKHTPNSSGANCGSCLQHYLQHLQSLAVAMMEYSIYFDSVVNIYSIFLE
jgi:hypothetical protein